MPLPEEFLYQLKLANPIESVIGGYTGLRRSGRIMLPYVRFIQKKRRPFTFIPTRRASIVSAAAPAEMS